MDGMAWVVVRIEVSTCTWMELEDHREEDMEDEVLYINHKQQHFSMLSKNLMEILKCYPLPPIHINSNNNNNNIGDGRVQQTCIDLKKRMSWRMERKMERKMLMLIDEHC